MTFFSDLALEAQIMARSLADQVSGRGLRLGVTGLSRAGKTVFITALVDNLLRQARLPVLRAAAEGRLISATLEAQPDDNVPRFAIEDHQAALQGPERHWPQSTRRISELRLTLTYQSAVKWGNGRSHLTIDIIDYPGEWLLDLPLLGKSYRQWSRETWAATLAGNREKVAGEWRQFTAGLDADAAADEGVARRAAELFTDYLRQARTDDYALSTLPPGRFLLPGDLEGSPALTFAPLALGEGEMKPGSLAAMMQRRFDSYCQMVVKPFFRDHFARLDRQIVLVDALAALNSGPAAMRDLETALVDILAAFRAGRAGMLTTLLRPRIDKILFAATKADHLHHTSHDRLEAILRLTTERAIRRVEGLGAQVEVIALAAVRATREANVRDGRGAAMAAVIGTPLRGEIIDGEVFDGNSEAAIYPGDLPSDPAQVFQGDDLARSPHEAPLRFVRFRPPLMAPGRDGRPAVAPQIRLDRALEFLIGDRLQ
ncbi:MAG: YcjX family protein [Hyphomicrobiales bacterium]|nr:YcjX family protein [Hyphomicrobiales bacterium]